MNNEEKILSMLEDLTKGQVETISRIDKLETELKADISELRSGQSRLEEGQKELSNRLKDVCEQTAHLTEFEAETRSKPSIDELFGKYMRK